MTIIKNYTDLQQSKKLAEILPMESVDMYYPNRTDTKYQGALPIEWKRGLQLLSQEIPCWSLAALLNVLPKYIDGSVLRMDIGENDFNLWFDDLSGIVNILLPDITKDNPIDACYEMILKLNEQKLL